MFHIHERALLSSLRIGMMGGTKEDKEVTRWVEDSFNVSKTGKWNKKLMPQRLSKMVSLATKARNLHQFLTVPWDLAGTGMLSNELYFRYIEEMQPIKDEYLMEGQRIVRDYSEILETEKIRLGPHFKESDYPPAWKLADKFKFEISFYPVPESGDFRVELADYELDRIKQDMEKKVVDTVSKGNKALWLRIHEAVTDLVERLNGPRGMRYDSPVVDNIKKLAQVLPSLNFAQDPDLDQMAKDLEDKLTQYKPEELRDDEVAKEKVKEESEKIISRLSNFI